MRRRQLPAIGAIAAFVWLAAAGQAGACSCLPLTPETVEQADAAAIATLVDVRQDGGQARVGVFTYDVGRVLEGRRRLDRDRIRVRSPLDSAACGLPRAKGRYGLVLNRHRGRWSSSLCTVTSPEGLRALASGESPRRPYCWGIRR
jgi:hypothetical protein